MSIPGIASKPQRHWRKPAHIYLASDMILRMKTLVLFFALAAMAFAADITGKWSFEVVLDAGSGSPNFEFTQSGESLTGMYHGQFGDAKLTGTVKGDRVEFTFGGD